MTSRLAGKVMEIRASISRATARRRSKIGAVALVLAAVYGCGQSSTDPPPPDLLKAQRQALEKARAVDRTVQDAAQRTESQVDSQLK
jgi:hypothetical protein